MGKAQEIGTISGLRHWGVAPVRPGGADGFPSRLLWAHTPGPWPRSGKTNRKKCHSERGRMMRNFFWETIGFRSWSKPIFKAFYFGCEPKHTGRIVHDKDWWNEAHHFLIWELFPNVLHTETSRSLYLRQSLSYPHRETFIHGLKTRFPKGFWIAWHSVHI